MTLTHGPIHASINVAQQRRHGGSATISGSQQLGGDRLAKRERGCFAGKQVELIAAFADRAVISIANMRFFEEVQTPRAGDDRVA